MSELSFKNLRGETWVRVLALDVADLIVPPHHLLPISLIIFVELSEVVKVLSHSADDVLLRSLLVPFDGLEGKYL